MRDRVTPLSRRPCDDICMVRPPPISLRIRSAEVTDRARKLLRRLDEADLLQRRVKWQAAKALAIICEMNSLAGPKLRSMSQSARKCWDSEYRMIKQVLKRICERGV
ncbi:MAG: hypothetical protein WBM06_17875 [Pseudolabrys sp.]